MNPQSSRSDGPDHHAGAVNIDRDGRVSRRRLLAGSLATGVVAAGALRIAAGQDNPATPAATPGGTPTVDVTGTDQAMAEEAIARADAVIQSVGTDRDSVASSTAVSDIDPILAQAGVHRDRAGAALAAGAEPEAVREAVVAAATARTARLLLEARLSYPGLPSQNVRTSRELVRTYEDIAAASTDAAAATDANVSFFITNAQQLYASAFDLYTGRAFAQAAGTARAAAALARIATLLMTDPSDMAGRSMIGRGQPPHDRDGRQLGPRGGRRGRPGGMRDDLFGLEDEEPATVPAPDF